MSRFYAPVLAAYLGEPGGLVPGSVRLEVATRVHPLIYQTQQLHALCGGKGEVT